MDAGKRLCVVILAVLAIAAAIERLQAEDPAPPIRLPLTDDDIAAATGPHIYKFRVPMHPGTKFEIVMSVQRTRDEQPVFLSRYPLTSTSDANAVELLFSFLPQDGTLRGALLSQDKVLEYRLNCDGCSSSGFATKLFHPLDSIPGTHKTLLTAPSTGLLEISSDSEVCLIAVIASNPMGSDRPAKEFPRFKVSILFNDPPAE